MNILKSKESVGRVVLAVSSATVILMGGMLYDSNVELHERESQLGKTQIVLEHQQSDYKSLEQKFLSVESESQKLSKRQEELMSQINKLQSENKSLKQENENLKKIKADARSTASVASAKVTKSATADTGYKNWRKLNVNASGYSLIADSQGSDGNPQTATGTMPHWGTIAVDPRVIPLGSTVYIPKFNMYFKAEDTGGAIKGNKIDIYFNHGDQARQFGRQDLEIYVKP